MLQPFKNISIDRIMLYMILIGILTFFSYCCFVALGEGTIENSVLLVMAKAFAFLLYLFSFPSIYFLQWRDLLDPGTVLIGFSLNSIFFAFLIEMLSYALGGFKRKRANK